MPHSSEHLRGFFTKSRIRSFPDAANASRSCCARALLKGGARVSSVGKEGIRSPPAPLKKGGAGVSSSPIPSVKNGVVRVCPSSLVPPLLKAMRYKHLS